MLKDICLSCRLGRAYSQVIVAENDIYIRDTNNSIMFKAAINLELTIEEKPFTQEEQWVTFNDYQTEILIRIRVFDWKILRKMLEGLVLFKGFNQRYILLEQIANSSAMVYRCKERETQEIWIAKICGRKASRDELEMNGFLRKNPHKNVLSIRELYKEHSNYIMITPIMKGGTLNEYVFHQQGNLNPEMVQNIMVQILEGLSYLHTLGIMHRDIKMDNIMLEQINQIETLKIIDFGFATFERSELGRCGTPGYIAPEVFLSDNYTELCDIYSLSSVFHNLYSGKKMFSSNGNISDLNQQNQIQKATKLQKNQLANELFEQMNCEHKNRISVKQCLDHPYFSSVYDEESTISSLNSMTFPNYRNSLMEFI